MSIDIHFILPSSSLKTVELKELNFEHMRINQSKKRQPQRVRESKGVVYDKKASFKMKVRRKKALNVNSTHLLYTKQNFPFFAADFNF